MSASFEGDAGERWSEFSGLLVPSEGTTGVKDMSFTSDLMSVGFSKDSTLKNFLLQLLGFSDEGTTGGTIVDEVEGTPFKWGLSSTSGRLVPSFDKLLGETVGWALGGKIGKRGYGAEGKSPIGGAKTLPTRWA